MSPDKTNDWDPETYTRFRGLRLRPAIDLLAQVHDLPDGDIVDLGCGTGAMGEALAARFPGRTLIGVDNSPAMLADAGKNGAYTRLTDADAASWQPETPPALIYSNALCHWLADHDALFARLVAMLAPGGVLAVQMPRQYAAPSHALLRDIAAALFPDRFDFTNWKASVAPPQRYQRLLAPLGAVSAWETEYVQTLAPVLAPVESGHPVRHFTQSTAMRPFVEKMDAIEAAQFTQAYDDALSKSYPLEANGSVLFPFRRVFFVLTRPRA